MAGADVVVVEEVEDPEAGTLARGLAPPGPSKTPDALDGDGRSPVSVPRMPDAVARWEANVHCSCVLATPATAPITVPAPRAVTGPAVALAPAANATDAPSIVPDGDPDAPVADATTAGPCLDFVIRPPCTSRWAALPCEGIFQPSECLLWPGGDDEEVDGDVDGEELAPFPVASCRARSSIAGVARARAAADDPDDVALSGFTSVDGDVTMLGSCC